MDIVCIIQARMGSTRLPGKVLMDLGGKPDLYRVVDRVLEARTVNRVIVATTVDAKDDAVAKALEGYDPRVSVSRGSEDDVLDRYYQAAKGTGADAIVRITCDCPVIDPEVIDRVVQTMIDDPSLDYVSNTYTTLTYPDGLDIEIFTAKALEESWKNATDPVEREHVTPYIRRHPERFRARNVPYERDISFHRWTLDEIDDYRLLQEIYKRLLPEHPHFRLDDILTLFEKDPELIKINQHVKAKIV